MSKQKSRSDCNWVITEAEVTAGQSVTKAGGGERRITTDSHELGAGLLFLLREYYVGSFELHEDEIDVMFENEQKFSVTIRECP